MIARPVVSSRLPVGSSAIKSDGRGRERAGQRHALLLAARELRGIVAEAVAEAHLFEFGSRAFVRIARAGKLERRRDVFKRGHGRDQVKGLEDDADALAAKSRQGVFVQAAELDAVDLNFAFIGPLKAGHDHEQRRFARTGSPDYADRLALADCQSDVAQDMHARRAAAETEVDAAHRDRRKHHCPSTLKTKSPSYGHLRLLVQALAFAAVLATAAQAAAARTLRLVALGDSLTAGYGLPPGKAFPDRLEAALRAKGWDVKVINAGVSGDTAADGLARYDWSVPPDADALIIELGANDMLRGQSPAATKAALAAILDKARAAHLPALLAGMRAAPNLGPDYGGEFAAIYTALAESLWCSALPVLSRRRRGRPQAQPARRTAPERRRASRSSFKRFCPRSRRC